MAIKTVPIRSIEEKVENMYEAVCIMFGQAKRILDDRIVEASIKDAEEEDWGTEYLSPILSIKLVMDVKEAIKSVDNFISSPFEGGRHNIRLKKTINKI